MNSCPICTKWQDDVDQRVIELEHTMVSLNRDQFFAGYCFVYTKDHVTELFHLSETVRNGVMAEVCAVAEALYNAFSPDKINYELLGNMAPHMHWHVVPRRSSDALWPRPHWSEPHQELILKSEEYLARTELIRTHLGKLGVKGRA
ncbi:HIT family protein [Geomonas anaerohicana]|uniref:HIT family protein n=1 Tax=Geomonas anaerohicana TaxID=2798583 RepID=A0ABS0Y9U4_9BACT|nr:HIT family protein [Geomonas anaerohicana]MBJ6749045.1 HIT family protein [Geomonas anaerohicana]